MFLLLLIYRLGGTPRCLAIVIRFAHRLAIKQLPLVDNDGYFFAIAVFKNISRDHGN